MRRFVSIVLAVAASVPASASAQNQPDSGIPGSINGATHAMVVNSYGLTPNTVSAKEAMAQLNRLCSSKRRAERYRCEAAWSRINAHHARMQAEKGRDD